MKKFNFWKGNKVSGHFELTPGELVDKFNAWLPTKDRDWIEYYGIQEVVQVFISEALEAIGNVENDFEEYNKIEELLKPMRRKFLDLANVAV